MAAQAKTQPVDADVLAFVDQADPPARREEALALIDCMRDASGHQPVMWGASIIGFGAYDYTYESGHCGRSCRIGFSPRKAKLSVYLAPDWVQDSQSQSLLAQLGKHSMGKACLYINKLKDVDMGVLRALCDRSIALMAQRYPQG